MEQHESLGRIIACLHRQARSHFEKKLAPFHLGSGTLPVLMTLLRHDGMNQQELSERLHVDKATTTRAITKLVKEDYVTRATDLQDHRAYRLFVTKKARKTAPQIQKVLSSWTEILVEGFTPEEKKTTLLLLQRLRDNALRYKAEHP
jgi:DNA-binding MarR family transcriptional regulator